MTTDGTSAGADGGAADDGAADDGAADDASGAPASGERPPGPRTLPFVGTAPSFIRDPFAFREACAETYGDVVDISALGRRAYLVSHPDAVRRVLVDDHDRYVKPRFEMGFVDDVFGRGLSFLDGEAWRHRRGLLQPAFYRERVREYGTVMAECARERVAEWDDGERVRLDEEMTALTLRVLGRTLLGVDVAADRPELVAAFRGVNARQRIPQVFVPSWVPTPTNRRYREGLATLERTIDELVERRRSDGDGQRDRDSDGTDLLSVLLAATETDDRFTDEALRDELMGFLFAGHETTAMALTFTWLLLSENPETRDRLRGRLRAADEGSPPDPASAADVPLLDRVVSESLRLYPPSHSVAREPTTDVRLRGYAVPAGSSVHLPQWVVHRDERWYDDPGAFDPGRWTEDRAADRPEYAFFPFGGGPRQCIGRRFARLELRVTLATMLRACTLDVHATDPDLEAGLTLRPDDGIEATVRKGNDE